MPKDRRKEMFSRYGLDCVAQHRRRCQNFELNDVIKVFDWLIPIHAHGSEPVHLVPETGDTCKRQFESSGVVAFTLS